MHSNLVPAHVFRFYIATTFTLHLVEHFIG